MWDHETSRVLRMPARAHSHMNKGQDEMTALIHIGVKVVEMKQQIWGEKKAPDGTTARLKGEVTAMSVQVSIRLEGEPAPSGKEKTHRASSRPHSNAP